MVESAIIDVCSFLKAKHILIPAQNPWLRGSIACFRESNSNYSPNQLKDFVFTQWKLADLRDIGAPSFPSNCKTAAKITLPGNYAVQINYAMNISESFYKQLQKIRRPAAEDNLSIDSEVDRGSIEIAANRTLKFEITDGIVTLLGFEDRLIKKLVEPFVPGVKAILNGPIECRRGVLFLKNENIDIIGGEVDTLHVPNATENLLARALNQPENPDPYGSLSSNQGALLDIPEDDEVFLQIPDSFDGVQNSSQSINYNSSRNFSTATLDSHNTISSSVTSSRSEWKSNTNYSSTAITNTNQSNTLNDSLNSSVVELEDDDEFLLMAAETATLAEKTVKQNKTPPNTKQKSLHSFFSNNKGSERNKPQNTLSNTIRNDHDRENRTSTSKSSTNENELRAQLEESYSSAMLPDNQLESTYTSIFQNNAKTSAPFELTNSVVSTKTNNQKSNERFEKPIPEEQCNNVLSFPPKKYPCVQTVRGSVESISQKLSISKNKWILSAMVKFKGVDMEVDFSNEALDKVFGMTAAELQAKRKEVKHNSELKEKLNTLLKSSQQRIKNLDCDMKVHFTSYIAKPVILDILDH